MKRKDLYLAGVPLLALTLLAGCKHEENAMRSYEVTVSNLTEAQPFSPPALILHREGYHIWQIGDAATPGLEQLAEGGSTDALLDEAQGNHAVVSTAADSAAIPPGGSSSVIISAYSHEDLALSLAAMLVNTNDGITGLAATPLETMAPQQSQTLLVAALDAGTEANSESAATVPGPAAGGEGFNSTRDDSDRVGGHPGVISGDDGLAGSALSAAHRFDNPVARITITRLE